MGRKDVKVEIRELPEIKKPILVVRNLKNYGERSNNMRKYFYIVMIMLLVFLAACAAPTEAPTEEPEVAATEEMVEPEEEEAVIDTSVCGTDEEVTITYVGDPVDTAKEAELATIARFNEHCPNITVNRIDGEASTTL